MGPILAAKRVAGYRAPAGVHLPHSDVSLSDVHLFGRLKKHLASRDLQQAPL